MPSSKPGSSGGLLSPTKRCLCRRRSWPILQIWDDWEIIILPWDSWSSTYIIRIKNVGMSPVSVTKQDSGIGVTWAPRWINWTLYTYIYVYIYMSIYICVYIFIYTSYPILIILIDHNTYVPAGGFVQMMKHRGIQGNLSYGESKANHFTGMQQNI
jgi:hypothetical protein